MGLGQEEEEEVGVQQDNKGEVEVKEEVGVEPDNQGEVEELLNLVEEGVEEVEEVGLFLVMVEEEVLQSALNKEGRLHFHFPLEVGVEEEEAVADTNTGAHHDWGKAPRICPLCLAHHKAL